MEQMNLRRVMNLTLNMLVCFLLFTSQVNPQAVQSTITSVEATPCLYNGDYFPTGGWFSISVNHSGKCITSYNDIFLRQATCNPWDFNQRFRINHLGGCVFRFNVPSGKVIDNKYSYLTDGNTQWMWELNGAKAQMYRIEGSSQKWKIINIESNKCIDLIGGSLSNGAMFYSNTCSSNLSQQFSIKFQPNTQVLLQAVHSGLCLAQMDIVRQTICNSKDRRQQWSIDWSTGNFVTFSAFNNALDNGGYTQRETGLTVRTFNGSNNQNFWYELQGDGSFAIRNVTSGMCMDVYGAYGGDGVHLIQYPCNYDGNQRFRFLAIQ